MAEALSIDQATLLAKVDLFAGLEKVALARIAACAEAVRVETGGIVCRQGDPADALYIVSGGVLGVFVSSPDGLGGTRLNTLQRGEYFGEMALLTGEVRSATVRAESDAEVLRLDRDRFIALFRQETSLAPTIIATLSRRLRSADTARLESSQAIAQSVEQELRLLPARRRILLLQASLLDSTSPDMLRAILGPDADTVAEDVKALTSGAADLPTPLRRALRERLETEVGAERVRAAAQDATARLAEAGYWEAALGLAARYGTRSGWLATLNAALQAVPALPPEEAEPWVARVTDEEAAEETELALARAALHERRDDPAAAVEVVRRGLGHALRAQDGPGARRLSAEMSRLLAPAGAQPRRGIGYGLRSAISSQPAPRLQTVLWLLGSIACVVAGVWLARPQPQWSFGLFLLALILIRMDDRVPDFAAGLGLAALWILSGLASESQALAGFASTEWVFVLAVLAISAAIGRSGLLLRVGLLLFRRMPPGLVWQAGVLMVTGILLSPLLPQNKARSALTSPLAVAVAEASRFRDREPGAAVLGLAAWIGSGPLMFMFLNGSSTSLLAWGLLPPESRARFDWVHWFISAAPLGCFLAIASLVALFVLLRPQPSGDYSRQRLEVQLAVLGPPSSQEWAMVAILLLTVSGWVLAPTLGVEVGIVGVLGMLATVATGNFDLRGLRALDWNFLVWYGVALGIARVGGWLGLDAVVGQAAASHAGWLGANPVLFVVGVAAVNLVIQLAFSKDQGLLVVCLPLIPVAVALGYEPWIVIFAVLTTVSMWILPKQTTSYLVAYSAADGRLWSHQQAQRMAFIFAALTLLGLALSVPYWLALGYL